VFDGVIPFRIPQVSATEDMSDVAVTDAARNARRLTKTPTSGK